MIRKQEVEQPRLKAENSHLKNVVEIVQYCINILITIRNSKNFTFLISSRSYTIRYEENGVDGLQDKRGKRKSPEEMTEVENCGQK
ncbi:MAG: hypothetical protein ACLVIY_02370 [Anaerobutyricum soehngenii]